MLGFLKGWPYSGAGWSTGCRRERFHWRSTPVVPPRFLLDSPIGDPMNPSSPACVPAPATREAWQPPAVTQLAPLTQLTLETGGAIPGGGETTGGSTVIP